MTDTLNMPQMSTEYLRDLNIPFEERDIEFLKSIQSAHIAKYSFNSLAVVLGQSISLEITDIFHKIVRQHKGGYCFEHNKLLQNVLAEQDFDVRLLLARVVYNQDVDSPRTHRMMIVNLNGSDYIVDVGFGHFGARYPVKMEMGLDQDQGDARYRIINNAKGEYCYQIFKDGDFFTLYTFTLEQHAESDCMLGHFYSHQSPNAAFVNNLVVCRKYFNNIQSLRNGELHQIRDGDTHTTIIKTASQLHSILIDTYELDVDIAVSKFLFSKFVSRSSS
ncbi:MAG: arylamine N-acetyltransferase [Bermanella sp.]